MENKQNLNATDTSVQPDKGLRLSSQQPASVATDASSCQPENTVLRRCACCHRELPLQDFYRSNHSNGSVDSYCKPCRRRLSRVQRKQTALSDAEEEMRPPYPVITRTESREERMRMILHALKTVRESVERKRRRERESVSKAN